MPSIKRVKLFCAALMMLSIIGGCGLFVKEIPPGQMLNKTEQDHFVEINGVNYHYVEFPGERENVFLLHGFGSSTYTWEKIIPTLTGAGFHVWALDMKGFGWSDKPRGHAYDPFTLMEDVNAWMDKMGLKNVVFVGNSLGGAIAVLMALEHPDKVGKMVLVDAGGYPIKKPMIIRLAKMPLSTSMVKLVFGRWMVRWNLKEVTHDRERLTDEQIEAYYNRLRTKDALNAQTELARAVDFDKFQRHLERIRKLETEALILWGREDAWIPLQIGEMFRRDLKNSVLHVIPNCGHIPQEECPEPTAQAILDYIEGRPVADMAQGVQAN